MSKKSDREKLKKEEKKRLKRKEEKQEKKKKKTKQEKKGGSKADRMSAQITPEERSEMIATAAYYIAESHGFTTGRSEDDWRTAEEKIDNWLKGKKGKATGNKG